MNYRREKDKAMKEYFKPLGFKYLTKEYLYAKTVSDDIVHCVSVSDETRFAPQYFWLRIFVYVWSKSFASLVGNLLGKELGYRAVLAFETVPRRDDTRHVEITGNRPMEENMADFSAYMDKYVFPLLERFKDTKSVIDYLLGDKMDDENAKHWVGGSYIDYYNYPVAFYMANQHDRCLQKLQENREFLEWQATHPGSMGIEELERFRPFQAKLTQWIKEGRTYEM